MTTLGEIVDYVLENVGKADVGDPRALIRQDIIDLLVSDLPFSVGGWLNQGLVSVQVGYTASLSESGVYSLPSTLRSVERIITIVPDVSLAPLRQEPWLAENTFTHVDDFYYLWRYGDADSENPYGTPTQALLYADEIHLRPIPKQAGSPLWFGSVVLEGSLVQDLFTVPPDDSTVIEQEKLTPCLRAGATVLHALRERMPQVAQTWSDIFRVRKDEARAMVGANARNNSKPRDF